MKLFEKTVTTFIFGCIQKKPDLRCFSGLTVPGSADVTTQKCAIVYSFSEKYLKTARWSFVVKSFFDQAVAIFWFTSVNKCSCGYIIQVLKAKEIILTELSEKGRKGELYITLLNKSFGLRRFDLQGNKILLGKDCSNIWKKFWKWFYRSPSIILNLKSDSHLPKIIVLFASMKAL